MKTFVRDRRYAVITVKASGQRVIFGTYSSEHEAELVCERLRAVGCTANVETARGTDAPGLSRKERTPP